LRAGQVVQQEMRRLSELTAHYISTEIPSSRDVTSLDLKSRRFQLDSNTRVFSSGLILSLGKSMPIQTSRNGNSFSSGLSDEIDGCDRRHKLSNASGELRRQPCRISSNRNPESVSTSSVPTLQARPATAIPTSCWLSCGLPACSGGHEVPDCAYIG
jgi:hypothetical protein